MNILLATRNAHKLREIRELFNQPGISLQGLDTVKDAPEVVEDGDTFGANAGKKARALALHFNCWALADDSGLAVDALHGAPGVHSARYAGSHGDDTANNLKLLRELEGASVRTARFVCALALSDPEGNIRAVQGQCIGRIADAPRGDHGFGYDPLFIPDGYEQTFGELGPGVKHQLSHRARALQQAAQEWGNLPETA